MKKKFPKTIYVMRAEEGTANEYLLVHTDYRDAALVSEKIILAVYELKGVKSLAATPVLTDFASPSQRVRR